MQELPKGCHPGRGCFTCPYEDCVLSDRVAWLKGERGMQDTEAHPRAAILQRQARYQARYRARHRERVRAWARAYYAAHRDAIRAKQRAYYARKRMGIREKSHIKGEVCWVQMELFHVKQFYENTYEREKKP